MSARPLGVVRSRASDRETNPTSRAVSSCSELTRSTSDRPQRSKLQTRTQSISRRRAASMSVSLCGRVVALIPRLEPRRRRANSSSLHSPESQRVVVAAFSSRGWKHGRRARREAELHLVQKPPWNRRVGWSVFSVVWTCAFSRYKNYTDCVKTHRRLLCPV